MYTLILNFTYPLRCLRVPLGVRVPPFEYHWLNELLNCQVTKTVLLEKLRFENLLSIFHRIMQAISFHERY
jgi:hypothetical protein